VALADVEHLRALYELHNSTRADFPALLARDHLAADAEFVEFAAAPGAGVHRGRDAVAALFRDRFEAGAMRVEDLELTALDEHRVLAAFRIRMRGTGSGVETSMRIWNLVTLEGSRIARIVEFSDEAAALHAAGR
jgi:ketosteroid isomerase-like protein